MTIRAKLYAAMALTVLAPVVTIAVALHGMSRLDDRFDEVQKRAAVALGAALVIGLLLLTAGDIARLALEGQRQRRGPVP
jgi:hypothetical protein